MKMYTELVFEVLSLIHYDMIVYGEQRASYYAEFELNLKDQK